MITTTVPALLTALRAVQGAAASPKAIQPALSSVWMHADALGPLQVQCCNLEVSASCQLPVGSTEDFSVVVPVDRLVRLLATYAKKELDMWAEDSALKLMCDRRRATLKGLTPDEFPRPDFQPTGVTAKLSLLKFREMAKQVLPTVAGPDESCEVLQGVNASFGPDGTQFVSADGIHTTTVKDAAASCESPRSAIVLSKALAISAKSIKGFSPDDVSIVFGKEHVLFGLGDLKVYSQLVAGNYPDTTKVVPTTFSMVVEALAQDLAKACKTCLPFAKSFLRDPWAKLIVSPSTLRFSVLSSDVGDVEVNVPVTTEGEKLEIRLALRKILRTFQLLKGKVVRLAFSGETSPVVITAKDSDSYQYTLMPLVGLTPRAGIGPQ